MSEMTAPNPQTLTIVLPAVFSPGEAVMVRNTLLSAIQQGNGEQTVCLDASAVVEISLQGLQVLLAFIQQMDSERRPWSLHAPSEELVAMLEVYGLFSRLMSWPVSA